MVSTHSAGFLKRLIPLAAAAFNSMSSILAGPFETPIAADQVDPAAFSQSSGGAENPVSVKEGPAKVLWTRSAGSDWGGVDFGDEKAPGIRHLRLGFKQPVPIGSVMVRGGGRLSVLRPGSPYPGNLSDESQWLAASRLGADGPTDAEVPADEYAVWVLPPGTDSRALRFTHEAAASDPDYQGHLAGVLVLADRMTNAGPQAVAFASERNEIASRINNATNDRMWQTWNNGESGSASVVSPEHPEWLMLVWPEKIPLNGLAACWAGFRSAEVEIFTGPDRRHPRDAPQSEWQSVAKNDHLASGYPRELAPNWFPFSETVRTRAVRIRIDRPLEEKHDHLRAKIRDGRGVWLGELLAMRPLGDAPLSGAAGNPNPSVAENPPIPVKFTLPEAGNVTLVIEDETGQRIRNLIADVPFPAGENTAWWDGSDDLTRDLNAARHGLYQIPTRPVSPGRYRVRGLWRKPLHLSYEFTVYHSGTPPWSTADHTGGWMTNHTPPTSAALLPADRSPDGTPWIYLGAYVSEGGHGLQWVTPEGRKIGGQGWIGGNWTGAPTLTVDLGENFIAEHLCYAGSVWEGELRITAKTRKQDQPVIKLKLGDDPKEPTSELPSLLGFDGGNKQFVLAGIAAWDGVIAASMVRQNEVIFIDARTGKLLGRDKMENPRGVAFDREGRLLVLSRNTLRRHSLHGLPGVPTLDGGETLVRDGLDDPRGITLDGEGRIYVSDRGNSHQVKIFSAEGKQVAAIGRPGPPVAGPYDELHLNDPNGMAVDRSGNLWVTEDNFQPKRVSVWNREGNLLKAWYGPGEYGGGGTLDPSDPNAFHYRGMEFELDWKAGTNRLKSIHFRPPPGASESHSEGLPEQPIVGKNGTRYFTNCYNSNPTGGSAMATLWIERDGLAVRCAAVGRARDWPVLLQPEFRALWPHDPAAKGAKNDQAVFAWSDRNDDGAPQPEEVTLLPISGGGVVFQPDLSVTVARWGGNSIRLSPVDFTHGGVPVYDPSKPEIVFSGAQNPASSGGDQVLTEPSGWAISTVAMQPFAAESLGGAFKGRAMWSYPSLWPGLHASHEAPVPGRPGEIIGTTRLLGSWVTPRGGSDAGPLFAVNGNMGNIYLFTADGLFAGQLFQDVRVGQSWAMPRAQPGMNVDRISLHDENFWPTISQTPDGKVFLVDGARTSLIRVDGLDSIRRIGASTLTVTPENLKDAAAWRIRSESARRARLGGEVLKVALRESPPAVDGNLADWQNAAWADIDQRGTAANFNSNSKPYDVSAALCIAGDRLFAAFRTGDKDLLKNSAETPLALFKSGGCLDLMIASNSVAPSNRTTPVPGDSRLLVTLVDGQPRALLYRPVVAQTREPVAFSSPWRTLSIDRVDDVSNALTFARDGGGNYEFSIPLSTLGLGGVKPGITLAGDLGILRGNGFQTLQRVYWSNKASAIVSDVPSEAQLVPALWGKFLIAH